MSFCLSGCCVVPAMFPSRPRWLLDLLMPGMDGFKVMEGLKEIEEDSYLPVIVITAQPDQKLRALRAGAKDFVSKPFDMAEVLARVYNMLEVRLLHAELQKALENVKLLSGLLPICMWCKKIRDDQGYWEEILGGDVTKGKMRIQPPADFSSACCREESSVINVR